MKSFDLAWYIELAKHTVHGNPQMFQEVAMLVTGVAAILATWALAHKIWPDKKV